MTFQKHMKMYRHILYTHAHIPYSPDERVQGGHNGVDFNEK